MSGYTDIEKLYSAIEKSARLVDAACSRDMVLPILSAYENAIPADGGIVFSTQTGENQEIELEYTMQVAGIDDPYAHALANGFVAETGHPVDALLSDMRKRISIDIYAVDCGVAGGFKKIYSLFPRDMQGVSKLADIPSMPPALAENAGFFARYGLDDAAVIGIDYRRKTMNVYFQLPAPGMLEPKTVLSMLREVGLPEPEERMLEFSCRAYRIYATLGWDSSKIQRISFAPAPRRNLDLSVLPAQLKPEVEQFMGSAPYEYAGERICTSVVKWSLDGEFLDFGSYYQISPQQLKALAATNNEPE